MVFNIPIPSFFDLKLISPLAYHFFTLSSAVIAIIIMFVMYLHLIEENRYNEIYKHNFWITSFLVLGVMSQAIQITLAYEVFNSNLDNYSAYLKREYKLELVQIIFLVYVILFVLFSVILTKELNKLRICLASINNEVKESWLGFKMVILLYLILMVIIYIFAMFYRNYYGENIFKTCTTSEVILAVFPYLIHFFCGIYMLSLYKDLKCCSFGIFSLKSETDYLYDESDKNMY